MNSAQRILMVAVVAMGLNLAQAQTKAMPLPTPGAQSNQLILPNTEAVKIEQLASGLKSPWSLAFIGKDEILISEKHGGMRLWRAGTLAPQVIPGGPPVPLQTSDSGILDIALDPDFASNRFIYISFVEGDKNANHTAIWKAVWLENKLTEGRVIFRAKPDKAEAKHPGGRMLFLPDKSLLLTIGDGFHYKAAAQDLGSHLGKTLRLDTQGRALADNPFVKTPNALPEIWTYGHRNAQGLARDATTGEIWLHEHGPRGGDEVNLLVAGANYGWPLVTHGIDYDGSIISEYAFAPGIQRSSFVWVPSIAPSGLAVYRGDAFPDWNGKLLVGALAGKSISRLRKAKDAEYLIEEERMLGSLKKRIRDVRVGADGLVYVLTDSAEGELLRLRPN